jgi:hypothetical protein
MKIRGWTKAMGQGFCGDDENYTLAITSWSQTTRAFVTPSTDLTTTTVVTDFIPWSRHHMMMSQEILHPASPTYVDD